MSELLPSGKHFGGLTEMVNIREALVCSSHRRRPLSSQGGGQFAPPLDGVLTSRVYAKRQPYEKIVQLPACLGVRQ